MDERLLGLEQSRDVACGSAPCIEKGLFDQNEWIGDEY